MERETLYKYLDLDGALAMLKKKNIQFTNATQFNDPFDCHPYLLEFVNTKAELQSGRITPFYLPQVAEARLSATRDCTWLCCLSKSKDNLLMWSYYTNHVGVCLGLERRFLFQSFWRYNGIEQFTWGTDVQYKDILDRPRYYEHEVESFQYQICTKGMDWQHEQEVRFAIFNPVLKVIPNSAKWYRRYRSYSSMRTVRLYPTLSPRAFQEVYFGLRTPENIKKGIIKLALKVNPAIKFYQMKIQPDRFALQPELMEVSRQ
jgi:hypothetical protein